LQGYRDIIVFDILEGGDSIIDIRYWRFESGEQRTESGKQVLLGGELSWHCPSIIKAQN
jgi:hypothetical protein